MVGRPRLGPALPSVTCNCSKPVFSSVRGAENPFPVCFTVLLGRSNVTMCATGSCKLLTNATNGRSHSDILKGLNGVPGQRAPMLINSRGLPVSPQHYSELELKHTYEKTNKQTTPRPWHSTPDYEARN